MRKLSADKIDANVRRFGTLRCSNRLFPDRLTLELSYTCNLACPVCPRHHVSAPPSPGIMATDMALGIVREAAAGGVRTLVPFFRGEPLLHPEIITVLGEAKRLSLTIQIASNATLLDAAKGEGLLGIGLDFISFSVDSITPATYEKSRKNAELGVTIANIERFLEQRARMRASTTVQVSAVLGALPPDEERAFIDFWLKRVDRVRLYPPHSQGGAFGALPASAKAEVTHRLPCLKLVTDMVVLADGNVAICNHDWDRGGLAPLGSWPQQSLAAIYNGPAYAALRDMHAVGDCATTKPCDACDHWQAPYLDEGLAGALHVR